jgi:uncharacterized protein YecE (DUF72 family)
LATSLQARRVVVSEKAVKRHVPEIRVGTSGWSYTSWRSRFFPEGLKAKYQFAYYARKLSTTELNGTFYRTPSLGRVRSWHDTAPPGFLFAWKASRFITHWKRLSAKSRNSLDLIEERLGVLGPKAGPVLFQLPPHFGKDVDRLAQCLKMLSPRWRYVFEFRDPHWYSDDVLQLLQNNNVALCLSDHHDAPAPWERTADHVYVRAHGPAGTYKDRYASRTLRQWAERAQKWRGTGHDVYVYFDNDQKSAAPFDALRLVEMISTP